MAQYTKEFIQDGNEKMAKFMGYTYFPYSEERKGKIHGWLKADDAKHPLEHKRLHFYPNRLARTTKEIRYFNDWNLLMDVVDKIETYYDEQNGHIGVYISSNNCTIQGTKLHLSLENPSKYGFVYFDDIHAEDKIKATWLACLNFIDWYNNEYTEKN